MKCFELYVHKEGMMFEREIPHMPLSFAVVILVLECLKEFDGRLTFTTMVTFIRHSLETQIWQEERRSKYTVWLQMGFYPPARKRKCLQQMDLIQEVIVELIPTFDLV